MTAVCSGVLTHQSIMATAFSDNKQPCSLSRESNYKLRHASVFSVTYKLSFYIFRRNLGLVLELIHSYR